MINFRTVADLSQLIKSKLHLIPDVDCIAGVPRSGMLPATLIALYLGKPLVSVESLHHGDYCTLTSRIKLNNQVRRVLVIDDSCSSGNAMNQVRNMLSTIKNKEFVYCAVYVTQYALNKQAVNFYFEQLEHVRLFEWNILNHNILQRSCVDLDGILGVDPTNEENDDGENYRQFLINAKPKFIPHYTIKAIVTCRLEKYRQLTEQWLKQHNVRYEQLYMMNYPDAATRRADGKYAQYKAEIYKQTDAELFYESSDEFAKKIHALTNKPVYCTDTNIFY